MSKFTIVQTGSGSASIGAGGGIISASFPSPVTAGNTILAIFGVSGGQNALSVPNPTDTRGTTYSQLFISSMSPGLWPNIVGKLGDVVSSGSCTISSSFGSASSHPPLFPPYPVSMNIYEISGFVKTIDSGIKWGYDASPSINATLTSVPTTGSNGTYGSATDRRMVISVGVNTETGAQSNVLHEEVGPGPYSDTCPGVGGTPGSEPGYPLIVFAATWVLGEAELFVSCGSPPVATVGAPYTHSFLLSGGGASTWAITAGALPDGLALNSSTGAVSGTPTTAGPYDFTVSATYAFLGISNSADCSISVTSGALTVLCDSPPDGEVGTPYTHTFPAVDGTAPYTFAQVGGTLPPGLSLDPDTGDLAGTPTVAGTYGFTIEVTDADDATDTVACSITITEPPLPPGITCDNPPDGEVGTAYTHTFPVTDGLAPFTFGITAGEFPPGLTLDPDTGDVRGTPTTAGDYDFVVTVTDDASQTATVSCSISIPPLGLACDSPPAGVLGTAYFHALQVSGGNPPYTFALIAGALPGGLSLDPAFGTIGGTPSTIGTYSFTVEVTDESDVAAAVVCSITVDLTAPPSITPDVWLDLWVWRELFRFDDVDVDITFPPGYERAMMLQLAVDFGRVYPGHDMSRVRAKLESAIEHIEVENISNSQALEELPRPEELQ